MRQPIYVAGHPRSGTTWLTRLLGDVLNCPTGGGMPSVDAEEIVTEGWDRPGPFVIRRGHFSLVDEPGTPFIVRPHAMNWAARENEPVVYIVRDPRDVVVSSAFYFNRPVPMELAGLAADNGWCDYVNSWLGVGGYVLVKYEALLEDTLWQVYRILNYPERFLLTSVLDVIDAVDRQSFTQRTAYTMTLPESDRERHLKFLRKGIVGDWRNHFTPVMEQQAWDAFGGTMERLGYQR